MARLMPLAVVLVVLTAATLPAADRAAPATTAYPHGSVSAQAFGRGARSYWIFEPAEPRPAKAPVVVFHHGWLAVNPGVYGAWIDHLARSGRIVIFPRYQTDFTTRPDQFLPNSAAAVRDAIDVLATAPGRVRPDLNRFALIGHSAGGNLSVQMAAVAADHGLPRPRAVVAVCPGEVKPLTDPGLASIDPETLVVVAATDADRLVGDCRAREIYAGLASVPIDRKKFLLYRSDPRGPFPIVADHLAPTAALASLDSGEGLFRARQMSHARLDILDRHGFWRMADLTLDAAFAGLTLDEGTSKGALFCDLGSRSDGVPILPPICTDNPDSIPRIFPTNGVRVLPWNADEFRRMLAADRP
jgi:acetyl esterase/lipase